MCWGGMQSEQLMTWESFRSKCNDLRINLIFCNFDGLLSVFGELGLWVVCCLFYFAPRYVAFQRMEGECGRKVREL